MLVIVDDRQAVIDVYMKWFKQLGVCGSGFTTATFFDWFGGLSEHDGLAIEGFLIGEVPAADKIPTLIRKNCMAAIIAITEYVSLDRSLELFHAGFDDVVRKPVHVREILARIAAIARRSLAATNWGSVDAGPIRVFSDGRDPQLNGKDFYLPRRERRILEYLVLNRGRRVTKTQIFNAIYGIFDDELEENIVESHISKLRRKLRSELKYDPIETQRFLGYTLTV